MQVHCVRAFGRLADLLRQEAPFPAGLVLHSWVGSAEMTSALAALPGVHFSISGHLTRIKVDKAAAMLAEVCHLIPMYVLVFVIQQTNRILSLEAYDTVMGLGQGKGCCFLIHI